ncbi:pentatricopeptide repeat-containing protein At5g46100-like, partial [Phalaenopsis equestris]|uniref:pentatricopeptide repeat-containing protein At5g46100-like n=1 Tax=Phalaenopsis equestris TaxID=78828 RepID=UPI0009E1D957
HPALIGGLLHSKKLQESLEVFDGMRLRGRKPDAGLYGKIINALCDSRRFHEASNYLDEMVMSGIVPNRLTWSLHVRIHNMVIRGLCGAGELIRAFRVYVSSRRRGISIEVETYGVLVELWCRKGEVEKALGVVEEMVVDGCLPDSSVWWSVMEVLWGGRQVGEEDELVWEELVFCDGDHEVYEGKVS